MDPRYNALGRSQQDHQGFVDRFRQGPRVISDEEAASRYEQVVPNLPPDVYQRSAQEVFAQLTPEQRMQLGQALVQSARQQGQSFPDVNQDGIDDRLQDPDYLAQTATQVQQGQPGLLGRLLGGGRSTPSGGVPAGSIPQGGGMGGMLGSPMAKGILGGIAAAGLMNMLTGPHYYSGGLFGAPAWADSSAEALCSSAITASERDTRKDMRRASKRAPKAISEAAISEAVTSKAALRSSIPA